MPGRVRKLQRPSARELGCDSRDGVPAPEPPVADINMPAVPAPKRRAKTRKLCRPLVPIPAVSCRQEDSMSETGVGAVGPLPPSNEASRSMQPSAAAASPCMSASDAEFDATSSRTALVAEVNQPRKRLKLSLRMQQAHRQCERGDVKQSKSVSGCTESESGSDERSPRNDKGPAMQNRIFSAEDCGPTAVSPTSAKSAASASACVESGETEMSVEARTLLDMGFESAQVQTALRSIVARAHPPPKIVDAAVELILSGSVCGTDHRTKYDGKHSQLRDVIGTEPSNRQLKDLLEANGQNVDRAIRAHFDARSSAVICAAVENPASNDLRKEELLPSAIVEELPAGPSASHTTVPHHTFDSQPIKIEESTAAENSSPRNANIGEIGEPADGETKALSSCRSSTEATVTVRLMRPEQDRTAWQNAAAECRLLREPDNPSDTNAIAATSGDRHLGYIPRAIAAVLGPALDEGAITCKNVTLANDRGTRACVLILVAARKFGDERLDEVRGLAEASQAIPDHVAELLYVCRTVRDRDGLRLLGEETVKILNCFIHELPDPCQRLVGRMLKRKAEWFRVAQSGSDTEPPTLGGRQYDAEVPDLLQTLDELATAGAIEQLKIVPAACAKLPDTETLCALCTTLSAPEAKSVAREAGLLKQMLGTPNTAAVVQRLQQALRQQCPVQAAAAAAAGKPKTITGYFSAINQTNNRMSVLGGLVLSAVGGHCVRLSPSWQCMFKTVELLFYLESGRYSQADAHKANTVFVLQRIGLIRFVPYVCKPSSLFQSRADLQAYQEALSHLHDFETLTTMRPGGVDCLGTDSEAAHVRNKTERLTAPECLRAKAQISADWLVTHHQWRVFSGARASDDADSKLDTGPGAELRDGKSHVSTIFAARFSAAWVHSRVVSAAIPVLEAVPLRDHKTAVHWLRGLLSSECLPARRAGWWNRLTIDLKEQNNLGRPQEAWDCCVSALADPWVLGRPEYRDLHRRFHRLSKKLGLAAVVNGHPVPALCMSPIRHTWIRGRALNSEPGQHSRFFGLDDEVCRVEQFALQHYAQSGWAGVHDEGASVRTLFALLLWPAIFATDDQKLAGVFQTPFQSAPLDLHTEAFYPARQALIDTILAQVRQTPPAVECWAALLAPRWGMRACAVAGVHWDIDETKLAEIAAAIGGVVLAGMLEKLARDYASWHSGFPDLLLWRTSGGMAAKFVEVKSERDRASSKQVGWMLELQELGADVEFLHIQAAETKRDEQERRAIEYGDDEIECLEQ